MELSLKKIKDAFIYNKCRSKDVKENNRHRKELIQKLCREHILCDDFFIRSAHNIDWFCVFLHHGFSPVIFSRFRKEIESSTKEKGHGNFKQIGLSDGFQKKYNVLLNNLKEMFIIEYVDVGIDLQIRSYSPLNVDSYFVINITLRVERLRAFNLKLQIVVNKDGHDRVSVIGRALGEYSETESYYESNNIDFDHTLYHCLKYFREVVNPGHQYKNVNYVKKQVGMITDDWVKKQTHGEDEIRKIIEEYKIKGVSF